VRLSGRAKPLGLKPANLKPALPLETAPAKPESAGTGGKNLQYQESLYQRSTTAIATDLLLKAATDGDGAAVVQLLEVGTDLNARVTSQNESGQWWNSGMSRWSGQPVQTTALFEAAGRGRLEIVRLLLDTGADPSRATSGGTTPLMGAAVDGHLELLQLLLARGAAADAVSSNSDYEYTAFGYACAENHPDCAEALLRAGCDMDIKDGNGVTRRQIAERMGHKVVLARLEWLEAERCGEGMARSALEIRSDKNVQMLWKAAVAGDRAAVAKLLEVGADPNALMAAQNDFAQSVQTTALLEAESRGRLRTARPLAVLDAIANLSRASSRGTTPLMEAAANGSPEVLRLLLARGAITDAVQPATGATALYFACANDHPDCAELLVRAGCDVETKSNRRARRGGRSRTG
jgi:ankyrin repeat protein